MYSLSTSVLCLGYSLARSPDLRTLSSARSECSQCTPGLHSRAQRALLTQQRACTRCTTTSQGSAMAALLWQRPATPGAQLGAPRLVLPV